MYVEYIGPSKILWLSFCSSKKSPFEKMGDVGRFVIGECVTAKAIHVLHLSECARSYGNNSTFSEIEGDSTEERPRNRKV